MHRLRIRNLPVITIAASLMLCPAVADDAHHMPQHGGKVVESGHHHVEILVKDGSLEVYINGEDGKPEATADATASAAVLSDGKKHDVALASDAAKTLKGSGDFKAVKGTTVVVTFKMPGHKPEQARIKID